MINSLDEAIKHCEEKAEELEKQVKPYQCESINKKLYEVNKKEWDSCLECAKEHRQLAEWLRELKDYKDARVGCEYCKHNYREQHERPCSLCQRNFMDMFESEVKADD